MQTLTYSQYCKNNQTRKAMTFMEGKFIYKSKKYSLAEIDDMFPIDLPIVDAMDRKMYDANPDKSKNYLKGIKSY